MKKKKRRRIKLLLHCEHSHIRLLNTSIRYVVISKFNVSF